MDFEISRIYNDDIAAIQKIEDLTNLNFWGAESYRTLISNEDYVYARIARTIKESKKMGVGFVMARFINQEAEIMKIAVHPDYQKMGVGGQLLHLVIDEASSRHCKYCYLEVRKSNLNAIQFYRTHKFEFFGYRKNYYSNPIEDACVMRRGLR